MPGVSGVEAAYSADVLATLNDEQYVMRVHSLSPSAATAVKTDAGAISSDDANYSTGSIWWKAVGPPPLTSASSSTTAL